MKLVKFVKENKIIVLSLLIVVLSFVFLALPKAFAHFGVNTISKSGATYKYYLSGYEWTFGTVTKIGDADTKIGSAVASGIAAIALLGLSFIGLLFSKKSSFVALLVSLALITVAILYFCSSAASAKAYASVFEVPDEGDFSNMSWAPYVIASINLVAGGLMMYRTILVMKDEVKKPSQAKGSSYSYLRK